MLSGVPTESELPNRRLDTQEWRSKAAPDGAAAQSSRSPDFEPREETSVPPKSNQIKSCEDIPVKLDRVAAEPPTGDVGSTESEHDSKFIGHSFSDDRARSVGSTISIPGIGERNDSNERTSIPPGSRFGKYELLEEIGRGGMGVVYKARQTDLDRIVALKMILSNHLASGEQVARFYAEARAAARMNSPHVVRIHEVGSHDGQHFFTMEYVAGPSLAAVVKNGPLPFDVAARYVKTVALGVDHLHSQGVVHRDLKPSNVLLDENDEPSVTDFGLAKTLQGGSDNTSVGAIVGTPSYMAPEQASASRSTEVGPRSDVYSLGAILYELITGRPPFHEQNPLDTLVQVLEGEPPRPGRLRPNLPRGLELICLKCLEKNPDDRYATAAELAADLERFLKKEQLEVKNVGVWHRFRRWSRREPALVSRIGTMALVLAIIQINHSLVGSAEAPGYGRLLAVVAGWAVASIGYQALLRDERRADLGRYAWAWTDVFLFTLIVYLYNGLSTSLVAGYFLIVSASGLWFRERLVYFTTVMSVLAYASLVAAEAWTMGSSMPSPYRHVIFTSVLAVSGLIIAYQVKRVRALSLYYERRPLP